MKFLSTIAALALLAVGMTSVQASDRLLKVGTLSCNVEPSIGFVIGSERTADCTYRGTNGVRGSYTADIGRLGIDVGVTAAQNITWLVFATNSRSDLSGTYVGASAEASLGLGGNANLLYGGSARSIALQPLSGGPQFGLNFAIGGTMLTLTAN